MTVSENDSPPELTNVVIRQWMEKQRLLNGLFKQQLDEILVRLDAIEQQLAEGGHSE